jgi:iron complex transport system ATP-binding protein
VTALVGPNGAGKSTLLRCIAGLQRHSGHVAVSGRAVSVTGGSILYLPQEPPPASTLTVFETVLLAHQRGNGFRVRRSATHRVAEVLTRMGLGELADRKLTQLSGGQRQLAGLAQAVVRGPEVLLLDEPTSNLDLHNQLAMLELIRQYAIEQPAAVIVTIHDLAHAARFADRVIVLHDGTVHASGTADEVITEEMLREVYRVDATVHRTSGGTLTLAVTGARLEDVPGRPAR